MSACQFCYIAIGKKERCVTISVRTIILHHEKCEPFGRAFYVSSIVVFSTLTARYIIASRNREPVLRDVTVEKVRKRGKNS